MSPEPPGTLPEALTGIAKEGLIQGGIETVGAVPGAIGRALNLTPARWYQSALKPALGGKVGRKVPEIIETGLRERIVPGEAGSVQVEAIIDEINQQVKAGIQARQAQGLTIDPLNVVRRLDDLRSFYAKDVNPQPYLAAIDRVENDFLAAHGVPKGSGPLPRPIPILEAQETKQATYANLRKSYGEMATSEKEAKKGLARGIKEEIESVFPEVKNLNDRERRLIDLDGAIQQFMRRQGNLQITGIGTPITAGAAALATGSPQAGMAAGMARAAMEYPPIKARIAFALHALGASKVGKAGQLATQVINPANLLRAAETYLYEASSAPPPPVP